MRNVQPLLLPNKQSSIKSVQSSYYILCVMGSVKTVETFFVLSFLLFLHEVFSYLKLKKIQQKNTRKNGEIDNNSLMSIGRKHCQIMRDVTASWRFFMFYFFQTEKTVHERFSGFFSVVSYDFYGFSSISFLYRLASVSLYL